MVERTSKQRILVKLACSQPANASSLLQAFTKKLMDVADGWA